MSPAQSYYDELEIREPELRETALMSALPGQIDHAKSTAPGFARILADVDPAAVTGREALSALPVTRKTDLMTLQREAPPFGGLAAVGVGAAAHLFSSPGPTFEFDTDRKDFWRLARACYAAGFRAGEVIHNSFAYHLTPGGWIFDNSARSLGCAVIPGGVGNSEQQVEAIAHYRPAGFTGTPDFLKVLLDKAAELGADCSSITKALVGGGALFPSLRADYAARGVRTLQCYATADLGLIAYESEAAEGMILDESVIVEIVRPGSGDPLDEGEVGEVVVTTLNPDYPLIRFATGDLSAVLAGRSPCGRSNTRLKGWMGRADQATKIKGMFVQPTQVAQVAKRHPQILKARLVVERRDESDVMTLRCEVSGDARREGLEGEIAETLRDACKMKGNVVLLDPGSLPNDGKVVDDARSYD